MKRLVVATSNPHKVEEIRAILAQVLPAIPAGSVVSLDGFDAPDPVEDGVTFTENALIKARSACRATGLPVLADDSGLAVQVLGGSPGIFSARWCGRRDDEENRRLLLAQLADVRPQNRGAAFVCAVALVTPDGQEFTAEGRVGGHLLSADRGTRGFGYDPIFVPAGHQQTTAEMSAAEKNSLSHRRLALEELAGPLRQVLV